jgi:serine/threonine-protein kinase
VVEFRTLGTLDLRADDGRELHSLLAQPKRIALLAYLCIAHPRGYHRRDTLLGLFWPDSDQEHARTSLRKSLHVLRHSLAEGAIISRGDEEIAIDFQRVRCDAVSFEELVESESVEEALTLYRGDLLPGFFVDGTPEFEHWLHAERGRLKTNAARAAYAAAEGLEKTGDYLAALPFARRSLELAETDERTLRKVIALQFHAGDSAAAIESYEEFARRLATEYQTQPRDETRALIEQIRVAGSAVAGQSVASRPRLPQVQTTAAAPVPLSVPSAKAGRKGFSERWLYAAAVIAVLISAGFLWDRMRTPPSKQVLRYTLAIDSSESLAEASPWSGRIAISPDGTELAYIGGPHNQLLIRERSDLHARAVTGTDSVSTPFFSPDGRSVGFLGENRVQIASLATGRIINVSDSLTGVAGASWGSDNFIYVDGARAAPLARVRAAAGSASTWFTALDTANGEIDHLWPEVLPNGRGVLFTVIFNGKRTPSGKSAFAIAVAEVPSGKHRIILQNAVYPRYTEAGGLLYVTLNGTLMMVPFDQSSMRITGEPTTLIRGLRVGRFGVTDMAVSATGSLLYSLGAEQFEQELVWRARNGKESPLAPDWQGSFIEPALSPDGKSLAVSRSPDGRVGDVWVMRLDQRTAIKLTHEDIYNRGPTWTADGSSVTFTMNAPNGHFRLTTARADGTGTPVEEMHSKVQLFDPHWSPDGKWLISVTDYAEPGGGHIIGIRPGTDSSPTPIVAAKSNEGEPAISRNGKWLAYDSDETGRDEIYVVPFPNTASARWAITSGGAHGAVWSHSGNELFYRDRSGDLFAVSVTTSPTFSVGKRKRLFSAPYEAYPPFIGYDVSADDQHFVMIRQAAKEHPDKLIEIENWFEELKANSQRGSGGAAASRVHEQIGQ